MTNFDLFEAGTIIAALSPKPQQKKEQWDMTKYVFAVSVILCIAVLGMASAQQKSDDAAQKKDTKIQTGEVVSIDPMKKEIVIKDNTGAEAHLLISASTKITKAGKDITLADVKVGDILSSECEDSSDGCKAKSIQVTPPPPSQ
jgi:hypothetical protein